MKCHLMAVGAALTFALPCLAQYTFLTVDYPGAKATRLIGLNDHFDIVGHYILPGELRHAVKYSHGRFTPLDPTGILGTHASGANQINNRGDIVGFYADATGRHGFLLRDGVVTTIDYPGSTYSQVNGITDDGVILGEFRDSDGFFHGYLLRDGAFTLLDFPGAVDSFPYYMNSRGELVGEWDPDPNVIGHGFLLSKHRGWITIDAPGAPPNSTLAIGINDHGQILGAYQETSGRYRGFVVPAGDFAPEDFIFFQPPGDNALPETMNNSGAIVGYFNDSTGAHGFIAMPARPHHE